MRCAEGFPAWTKSAAVVLNIFLLAGCTTAGRVHDSYDADMVLVGRVTAASEFPIVRAPDWIDEYARYTFQPLDQPGTTVDLIGTGKCPLPTPGDQVYLVVLNKRGYVVGTRHEDLLKVVACTFVDAKTSVGVLKKPTGY